MRDSLKTHKATPLEEFHLWKNPAYLKALRDRQDSASLVVSGIHEAFAVKYLNSLSLYEAPVFRSDLLTWLPLMQAIAAEVVDDMRFLQLDSLGRRLEELLSLQEKLLHYSTDMWQRCTPSQGDKSQKSRKMCEVCQNIYESILIKSLENSVQPLALKSSEGRWGEGLTRHSHWSEYKQLELAEEAQLQKFITTSHQSLILMINSLLKNRAITERRQPGKATQLLRAVLGQFALHTDAALSNQLERESYFCFKNGFELFDFEMEKLLQGVRAKCKKLLPAFEHKLVERFNQLCFSKYKAELISEEVQTEENEKHDALLESRVMVLVQEMQSRQKRIHELELKALRDLNDIKDLQNALAQASAFQSDLRVLGQKLSFSVENEKRLKKAIEHLQGELLEERIYKERKRQAEEELDQNSVFLRLSLSDKLPRTITRMTQTNVLVHCHSQTQTDNRLQREFEFLKNRIKLLEARVKENKSLLDPSPSPIKDKHSGNNSVFSPHQQDEVEQFDGIRFGGSQIKEQRNSANTPPSSFLDSVLVRQTSAPHNSRGFNQVELKKEPSIASIFKNHPNKKHQRDQGTRVKEGGHQPTIAQQLTKQPQLPTLKQFQSRAKAQSTSKDKYNFAKKTKKESKDKKKAVQFQSQKRQEQSMKRDKKGDEKGTLKKQKIDRFMNHEGANKKDRTKFINQRYEKGTKLQESHQHFEQRQNQERSEEQAQHIGMKEERGGKKEAGKKKETSIHQHFTGQQQDNIQQTFVRQGQEGRNQTSAQKTQHFNHLGITNHGLNQQQSEEVREIYRRMGFRPSATSNPVKFKTGVPETEGDCQFEKEINDQRRWLNQQQVIELKKLIVKIIRMASSLFEADDGLAGGPRFNRSITALLGDKLQKLFKSIGLESAAGIHEEGKEDSNYKDGKEVNYHEQGKEAGIKEQSEQERVGSKRKSRFVSVNPLHQRTLHKHSTLMQKTELRETDQGCKPRRLSIAVVNQKLKVGELQPKRPAEHRPIKRRNSVTQVSFSEIDLAMFGGAAAAFQYEHTDFTKQGEWEHKEWAKGAQRWESINFLARDVYLLVEKGRKLSRKNYKSIEGFLRFPYSTTVGQLAVVEGESLGEQQFVRRLQWVFSRHWRCGQLVCPHLKPVLAKFGLV